MRIKVGLLLDSLVVPDWQYQIISHLKQHPDYEVRLIILNKSARKVFDMGRLVYKVLRKIDRQLFSTRHDPFVTRDVGALLQDAERIDVEAIQGTFSDQFPPDKIEQIQSVKPDLLIRFGFRILRGGILDSAKWGVWSLHHGDSDVNRGGPPAFWEVVNREPVTGVTLQVLSEDLDGGKVLGKSFICTDNTSYNRNQSALFIAGVELFCAKLDALAKSQVDPAMRQSWYSQPLYRDPGNSVAFRIAVLYFTRMATNLVGRFFRRQQWGLFYRFGNPASDRSLFRYKPLVPPSGDDWADPFVVSRDGKYYVFLEELTRSKGKARISYLVWDTRGKLETTLPQAALEESFHLSYPFIFEFENRHWMLPEAAQSGTVWLYRCESFPDQWVRWRELIPGIQLYDPTLICKEGIWYLFGTRKPLAGSSPNQYLYIYYSSNLLQGSWTPHPQNPVSRDARNARPAGRIFQHEGRWIRPAQIGAPKYGYGIQFMEITQLTPTQYQETALDQILPFWDKWLLAVHTFNADGNLTLIDGQFRRNIFQP